MPGHLHPPGAAHRAAWALIAVALALSPGPAAASLDAVIEAVQALKRAAPPPAASPLGDVIDATRDLKRRYAGEAPLPPPAPSLGRIVERAQKLKRQAAEAAEARDRETAALIKEVERPPSVEEINARKAAFIRDRLDPMLGARQTFLVNLDQHIRKHGILAFVAGLSDADKKTSAELALITEEQRALMAVHPDLFTADDLRSSQVLTDLLKLLAQ